MIVRVVLGLGLFLGSMGLGWWLHRQGVISESLAAKIVHAIVLIPSPIVLCLSFWKMQLRTAEPWLLPLLGTLISTATLLPAWWYARRARLPDSQTGIFLTCAFFSNLGYLGAFVAFALAGEAGYALCMLYLVFFNPCFYTLGFGIASYYGRGSRRPDTGMEVNGGLRLYPFVGMLVGVALSLFSVHRPLVLERVNSVLIPLTTAVYLVAVGTQVTLASPRRWIRPCLAMCGIKFLYTPVVAWLLLNLFHVTGLPRFIVLLESVTPVAVSPLVLPMLFGLDRKLANALWVTTTAASIPWLALAIPLLQRL